MGKMKKKLAEEPKKDALSLLSEPRVGGRPTTISELKKLGKELERELEER